MPEDEYPARPYRRTRSSIPQFRPLISPDIYFRIAQEAEAEGKTIQEKVNEALRERERLKQQSTLLGIIDQIDFESLNTDAMKSAMLMLMAGGYLARIGTEVGQNAIQTLLLGQQISPAATAISYATGAELGEEGKPIAEGPPIIQFPDYVKERLEKKVNEVTQQIVDEVIERVVLGKERPKTWKQEVLKDIRPMIKQIASLATNLSSTMTTAILGTTGAQPVKPKLTILKEDPEKKVKVNVT